MWVKICANTNLADALFAAELGADAVGFVFAPSARQVTAAEVAHIVPHLPEAIEKIGVFPAWDADLIFTTAIKAGLTGVQLHGGTNLDLCRELARRLGAGVAIIQTVSWTVDNPAQAAASVQQQLENLNQVPEIACVLIDSKIGTATGGTGVAFDWTAAQEAFRHHLQTILAGGLTPDNVQQAIQQVRPWGVDVASGVETCPGKKDYAKLVRFLAAARSKART